MLDILPPVGRVEVGKIDVWCPKNNNRPPPADWQNLMYGNPYKTKSWTGGGKGGAMTLAPATLKRLQKLGIRKERDVFNVSEFGSVINQHLPENKSAPDDVLSTVNVPTEFE